MRPLVVFDALKQHIEIADLTESAREATEATMKIVKPQSVEDRRFLKHLQRGSQPPRGDAKLVNRLTGFPVAYALQALAHLLEVAL